MHDIFMTPSFYAHLLNGLLMLFATVLLWKHYKQIQRVDTYKLIVLTLLFAITIGIHGLSHMGLEKLYHYNPLTTAIN